VSGSGTAFRKAAEDWNADPALNQASLLWAQRNWSVGEGMGAHPNASRDGSEDASCCRDITLSETEWAAHRASTYHLALLFRIPSVDHWDVFIPACGQRYQRVARLVGDTRPGEDRWQWSKALVSRGATVPLVRLFLNAGLELDEALAAQATGPSDERIDDLKMLAALRVPPPE
jgi:hypothetical protein